MMFHSSATSILWSLFWTFSVAFQSSSSSYFQDASLHDVLTALRLTTFSQYIRIIGLENTLRHSSGPFTIFAPQDDAFQRASMDQLRHLLHDESSTWKFTTYHLSSGEIILDNKTENGRAVETVLGARAFINAARDTDSEGTKFWFQGSPILRMNIRCRNGIIHVFNSLVQQPTMTISAILRASRDFRTYRTAFSISDVSMPTSATLVVPTDDAFLKLPREWLRKMLGKQEQAKSLILYHTLNETHCPDAIFSESGTNSIPTKLGKSLLTHVQSAAHAAIAFINNAAVYAIHPATNGWIIATIEVLLGDIAPSVLSLLKECNASEFHTLVLRSKFNTTLQRPWETITLFAPSNEAIAQLTIEDRHAIETNQSYRDEIIAFHVASGRLLYEKMALFENFNTELEGQRPGTKCKLRSNVLGEVKTVEGAKVLSWNRLASNGAVHIIDRLLIPPRHNLVDIIQSDRRMRLFKIALDKAKLLNSLKTSEMFTIIVPSDWAIIEHLHRNNETTTFNHDDNQRDLGRFLRSHIIVGAFFVQTLQAGQSIQLPTLITGRKVLIQRGGRDVAAGDEQISAQFNKAHGLQMDIRAINGVIHLVDNVLF